MGVSEDEGTNPYSDKGKGEQMLSKETFLKAIGKIKRHEALMDELTATLRKFGDFPLQPDFSQFFREALMDVLKEAMQDEYDYIGWWLYEAADYIVTWEENGETMSVNLQEPEALYNYLVESARKDAQG